MSICKRGHVIEYSSPGNDVCKHCARVRYLEQRPARLAKAKARYIAKKAELQSKMKDYAANHRDEINANHRAWSAKNYPKVVANTRVQQAARLQRVPPWVTMSDKERMQIIYEIRDNLELLDGTQYHVDHIYPLQGALVSGLHVPNNLRIIPARDNISKGNRMPA